MFLLFVLIKNHKIVQIYKKDMNLRLIRIQFIVGKNAVHAGIRRVNNGVLKPALVEMYKREYIFDKQKCIELLLKSLDCCDHYKIGILSGKKSYSPQDIRDFVTAVKALNPKDVAWKNSLLEYVKKP